MSIKLRVTSVGFPELVDWIGNGMSAAGRDPSVMVPMAHALGRSNSAGWGFSGDFNRDWQPLAEMTQTVREARGYDRKEPVLVESGQLKWAAVDIYLRWQRGQRQSVRQWTSPYNGSQLSGTATISNGTFTAEISGERVQNQYGGSIPAPAYSFQSRYRQRAPHLPARPFFGLEKKYVDEAVPAMMPQFLTAWQKQAHPVIGAY